MSCVSCPRQMYREGVLWRSILTPALRVAYILKCIMLINRLALCVSLHVLTKFFIFLCCTDLLQRIIDKSVEKRQLLKIQRPRAAGLILSSVVSKRDYKHVHKILFGRRLFNPVSHFTICSTKVYYFLYMFCKAYA